MEMLLKDLAKLMTTGIIIGSLIYFYIETWSFVHYKVTLDFKRLIKEFAAGTYHKSRDFVIKQIYAIVWYTLNLIGFIWLFLWAWS